MSNSFGTSQPVWHLTKCTKGLTPLVSFWAITSQRNHRYPITLFKRGFHFFIERREPLLMQQRKPYYRDHFFNINI